SSIRRRNSVMPAPTIATRFFIPLPPSFLTPLQLRSPLVFLASSEPRLSSPWESVSVPLVLGVVERPQEFCKDQLPLTGVQPQGTRLTRLQASDHLCRKRLTRPSYPL